MEAASHRTKAPTPPLSDFAEKHLGFNEMRRGRRSRRVIPLEFAAETCHQRSYGAFNRHFAFVRRRVVMTKGLQAADPDGAWFPVAATVYSSRAMGRTHYLRVG